MSGHIATESRLLRAWQAGLSLIELMIALALGVIIMMFLTAMYADISRTNQEMAKTNSQIENARFAMQVLSGDVVHGGYWVGFVPEFDDLTATEAAPTDVPLGVPDPCFAYTAPWTQPYKDGLFGIPVQAYESTADVGTCSGILPDAQASTDVLVVRHAETCVPGVGNCGALVANGLYFQVSNCMFELDAGTKYVFGTAGFTLHNRGALDDDTVCNGATAAQRRFISNIYYIRDFSVTAGDGIPTLMRSSFGLSGGTLAHQDAVPLVEGIEGFRVGFGVDRISDDGTDIIATGVWEDQLEFLNPDYRDTPVNRGDGSPDGAFVHCTTGTPCTVAQLSNVVAVKIYLLARADSTTPGYTDTKTYALGSQTLGPFNDGFKRHVFSSTVRLVNVSGRRETP